MTAPPSKPSVYAKRNGTSSVVPLEEDSDSDFNPGVYIPETKTRGRKQKSSRKSDELSDSPRPSKRRRNETLAKIGGKRSHFKSVTRSVGVPPRPNLLERKPGNQSCC
ncbi:hypothetical protein C2E23DRAFT_513901 [Lenzites betulinus]|nr:hypothetical protein C2E23DRAFT_513901 [Lenzites betulinus]